MTNGRTEAVLVTGTGAAFCGGATPSRADDERGWVETLIAQAQARRFYGKLTLIIEAGAVKRVVKEESLTPPS